MNSIEKGVEAFIAEMTANLDCPISEKKRISNDMRSNILDYIDENQIDDIKAVYQRFGKPDQVAKQFNDELKTQKSKKFFSVRKILLAGVIAVVVIFVIVMAGMWIDAHKDFQGYGVMSPAIEISENQVAIS